MLFAEMANRWRVDRSMFLRRAEEIRDGVRQVVKVDVVEMERSGCKLFVYCSYGWELARS